MRCLALRALAASVALAAVASGVPPGMARADPTLVFPGMEIHQGNLVCTLGYVDPVLKLAFTAGHCRGDGEVSDRDHHVIGHLVAFRDNTPSGSTVTTDQVINDYEAIALADNVTANNILPGGRSLVSNPGVVITPGQAVCHFGLVTGETCGTVESVNNGWFTMSHGVLSQRGDSGGPVYLAPHEAPVQIVAPNEALGQIVAPNEAPGQIVAPSEAPRQIIGIFNSVWGVFPAAVSWRSTIDQVRQDVGSKPPLPS
jgi:hypothetical protein